MDSIKKITQRIKNNINTDENIRAYADRMSDVYGAFALIDFSMELYSDYGMLAGARNADDEAAESVNDFFGIAKRLFGAGLLDEIVDLRDQVILRVENISAYIDSFSIYEHVLNRIEYRFSEYDGMKGYSDEDFCGEILNYIFQSDDTSGTGIRLEKVLCELPVRMTKDRFYEILFGALSVYKKSDKGGLDDFTSRIRTGAALCGGGSGIYELDIADSEFKSADFRSIDEQTYLALREKLDDSTKRLNDLLEIYISLTGLINDMYIITVTERKPDEITDTCRGIISSILRDFESGAAEAGNLDDSFVLLEGRQEKYSDIIDRYNILEDVSVILKEKENAAEADAAGEAGMADAAGKESLAESTADRIEKLINADRLTSGGMFVDFEKEADGSPCDEAYINKTFEKLKSEFSRFFKENQREVNRAAMAVTLSNLPVFFKDFSEMEEYILASLKACRDTAEKSAAVEIIGSFTEENYEVY